jgi:hypothetical protein
MRISYRNLKRAMISARDFGRRMHKIAAAPPVPAGQAPSPREFPVGDLRNRLAKLSPEAYQHAGLQPYSADWNVGQVMEAHKAIQAAPAGKLYPNMSPAQRQAVGAFNQTQTWGRNVGRRTTPPVVAQPGSPGYKPYPSVRMGAQPQAPQAPQAPAANTAAPAPPRMPAAPKPPAPPAPPPNPAVANWKLGDPVPAGYVVNSNDQLGPQSDDFKALMRRVAPPTPPPRMPQ